MNAKKITKEGYYWRFSPRGDNGAYTNPPEVVSISSWPEGAPMRVYEPGGDIAPFLSEEEDYMYFVGPIDPPPIPPPFDLTKEAKPK